MEGAVLEAQGIRAARAYGEELPDEGVACPVAEDVYKRQVPDHPGGLRLLALPVASPGRALANVRKALRR